MRAGVSEYRAASNREHRNDASSVKLAIRSMSATGGFQLGRSERASYRISIGLDERNTSISPAATLQGSASPLLNLHHRQGREAKHGTGADTKGLGDSTDSNQGGIGGDGEGPNGLAK